MNCLGCGSPKAVVVRGYMWKGSYKEVCNEKDCGNIPLPCVPDVYFRQPEVIENLADEQHPFGVRVESKRHKAAILKAQGLREDGDRVHGSRDKGVHKREFRLTPALEKKRDAAVTNAIRKFKADRGASLDVPMKMVRRK